MLLVVGIYPTVEAGTCDKYSSVFNGMALHFNREGAKNLDGGYTPYNEYNKGNGFECSNGNTVYLVGTYTDSFYSKEWYVGYGVKDNVYRNGSFKVNVFSSLQLMSHSKLKESIGVSAMILPMTSLNLEYKNYGVNITPLFLDNKSGSGLIYIQFTYSIKG